MLYATIIIAAPCYLGSTEVAAFQKYLMMVLTQTNEKIVNKVASRMSECPNETVNGLFIYDGQEVT